MNIGGNHAVARMFQVGKCLAALIRRMKRVVNRVKQRASLTGEQKQAEQNSQQPRMRLFDDCIFHALGAALYACLRECDKPHADSGAEVIINAVHTRKQQGKKHGKE